MTTSGTPARNSGRPKAATPTRSRTTTRKAEPVLHDLTKAEYDHLIASSMSESALQTQVIRALTDHGWIQDLIYHTHFSKRSNHGWPDLAAIRRPQDRPPAYVTYKRPRILYVELKTETGKLSTEQAMYLDALSLLRDSGDRRTEVYLLRPSDMSAFLISLREGPTAPGGLRPWDTSGAWDDERAKARPAKRGTTKRRTVRKSARKLT
jgi:ribosomal protein S8